MVERDEFLWRVHAAVHFRAQGIDPARHPGIEIRILPHRVIHALARLDDARQNLVNVVDGKGVIGPAHFDRPIGAQATPVPALPFLVAVAAEQQELTVVPAGSEDGYRRRLLETRQVVKITVLPIAVFHITTARPDRCGRQNRDAAATHHLHQILAAPCKFLAIQCKTSGSSPSASSSLVVLCRNSASSS